MYGNDSAKYWQETPSDAEIFFSGGWLLKSIRTFDLKNLCQTKSNKFNQIWKGLLALKYNCVLVTHNLG